MSSASQAENERRKSNRWEKIVILLTISLGLFWFTEEFSAVMFFEPWQGIQWRLWVSYAKDLIQPFAFYFFLCLAERWLKTWQVRTLIAFGIPMLLEFGQLLNGSFFVGRYIGAFDPFDFLMYATGVGVAVLLDQRVFKRLFKFW